MGSRRDNRSAAAAGPTAALHSKHHHEKRNHELLKRLASDATSPYPMSHSTNPMSHSTTAGKTSSSSSRGGVSVMSKSLTLDLGKGHLEEESVGKPRARRKADLDKSLKSLQRQTSSSAMKMSNSLNEKDFFMDNKLSRIRDLSPVKGKGQVRDHHQGKTTRKRDSLTGKSSTNHVAPHTTDKKGGPGAGENFKRADVFERLSRQDCNKGVTRSEHGPGNRIRDRSPAKTGRKSPQEKNVASDKHLTSRKSGSGDAPVKVAQSRKRDVSPMKREESGRRNISSNGSLGRRKITRERIRGSNHDLESDKDGSREKLEKDNVPESPDKDLKDSAVSDDADKNLSASACGKGISSSPSHQEQVGGVGGRGGGGGMDATSKVKLGHHAVQHCTPEGTSMASKPSPPDKVLKGTNKNGSSRESENQSLTHCKPANFRGVDTVPLELSKADVMQKVRLRVPDESKRDTKGVIDDDKDVCEAEKCEEDDDFYKIKVHTRLVTYSNSTLVIKNTSKCNGGGSVGEFAGVDQASDTTGGLDSSRPPPLPPPHTLQTSSMPPPAVPHSADVDEEDGTHALPTEAHQEETEGFSSSPITRSRSMRLRLSQFVCKGKNFLTDVYSATQSKLEQYARMESPRSNNAASEEDENTTPGTLPSDSDSGYYSICTSPAVMQPAKAEDVPSTSCPVNGACNGSNVRVDQESADGLVDSHINGIMTIEEEVNHKVGTGEMANEDDDDEVLPSIPSPHVNFTLNEDWIKKNILCTCKCKRNAMKMQTGQSNATAVSKISDTKTDCKNTDSGVIENANCIESNKTNIVSGNTEENISVSTDESISGRTGENLENKSCTEMTITADLDDLCLCSCHDGDDDQQLQQLPQEVQELLDADHARMWWTITGNFGNILPIDWSKTYTRQQYLPVLNLNEAKELASAAEDTDRSADDDAEEEEVAQDLDLHHLILNGLSAEPVKSAEEVIREIDDLMQEGSSSEDEGAEETSSSAENANEPVAHPLPPPLYAEKLNNMSIGELNESFMELEVVIRQYSETLINQLALRDELEYEKELKNSFISLLLQVQNKRRNFNVEKKKQKKYLTTVIPYDVGHGPPMNETLQILIKILMAINEDSPTVPTLLTDYILKVLCPS